MSQFLFQYHAVAPTTWVYLSSLLMIGLFFKFSRFWSVRNLDLLMLILLAPGLLLIHFGQVERNLLRSAEVAMMADPATAAAVTGAAEVEIADEVNVAPNGLPGDGAGTLDVGPNSENETAAATESEFAPIARVEYWGYMGLLLVCLLWLTRMMLDSRLTRRPLLSPNLSVGGMAFIGVALFVFLMANVVFQSVRGHDDTPHTTSELVNSRMEQVLVFQQPDRGPGYAALNALPASANKTIAILSHTAIMVGMVFVAYRHFGNMTNGIGAATLYLMLPYTSQMTGRVDHFLPAAFLVWAIFFYRRPVLSGLLVGAAFGCIYYPLFLLPLWIGFYWHRGWVRFLIGVSLSLACLMLILRFTPGTDSFLGDLQRMFGWLKPAMQDLEGIWNPRIGGWDPLYRLPVLVAFVVLSVSLLMWPAQKNLATLISCSAAMMLGSQFWHGFGGGLFIGWYLPLTLLMVFRPNLEDRVAQTMVNEPWFGRRRSTPTHPGALTT